MNGSIKTGNESLGSGSGSLNISFDGRGAICSIVLIVLHFLTGVAAYMGRE